MRVVNLEEMADILRISLPTMRRLVKRYPALPVLSQGSNGVPWQFDADAVVAFVRDQRAEEAAAKAARDEDLAQVSLPLEETVPPEERGISAGDRLKLASAMQKEDQLARERGFLVLKTEMRAALGEVWAPLNQRLQSLPAHLGRRFNLPEPVVRELRAAISAEQRELHRKLSDLLGAGAVPPPEETDHAEGA